MQFYPGDWLSDPALRACSMAAKGLWIDLLCLMWESPERGVLRTKSGSKTDPKRVAKMLGLKPFSCQKLITELEENGVLSRTENGDIFSRRMVRDEELRKVRQESGRKGGNPNLVNQTVKQNSTKSLKYSRSHISEVREELNQKVEAPPACVEVQNAPATPADVAMEFPINGGAKVWHLPRSKLSEWSDTFPGINVEAECKRARQWCIDNPKRRKTANGMLAFLFTWLSKEQNRGTGNRSGTGSDRQSAARYEGTFESDFAEVRRRNEVLQESSGGADGSGSGTDQASVSECGESLPF